MAAADGGGARRLRVRTVAAAVGDGDGSSSDGERAWCFDLDDGFIVTRCAQRAGGKDAAAVTVASRPTIQGNCIGVLYAGATQTTEDEIFLNTDASPAFWEFLEWLGVRTRLKGWSGYRGDLDVRTDTTGRYSYMAHHGDHEIMFHVAPMLPKMENAEQQLVRKRRIGNDITCIVFQDGGQFTPPIESQVLHNYIVVSPIVHKGVTFYKVSVARRQTVEKFGPPLALPSVYERNATLRTYLLTKLVNANLAAMRSPGGFCLVCCCTVTDLLLLLVLLLLLLLSLPPTTIGLASKIAYPAKMAFLNGLVEKYAPSKSRRSKQ